MTYTCKNVRVEKTDKHRNNVFSSNSEFLLLSATSLNAYRNSFLIPLLGAYMKLDKLNMI